MVVRRLFASIHRENIPTGIWMLPLERRFESKGQTLFLFLLDEMYLWDILKKYSNTLSILTPIINLTTKLLKYTLNCRSISVVLDATMPYFIIFCVVVLRPQKSAWWYYFPGWVFYGTAVCSCTKVYLIKVLSCRSKFDTQKFCLHFEDNPKYFF